MVSIKLLNNLYYKFKIRIKKGEDLNKVFREFYGVKIGRNVRFTGIPNWGSEPYLIEIGNDVTITQNVSFNTHDGGVGLFRNEFPGINVFGKIIIGNNVFIGSHCIILPDVTIGNNVIIGAGSVVTKNIPSNCVAVGSPAVVIKNIEDYKKNAIEKAIYIKENGPAKRKLEILSKLNNN